MPSGVYFVKGANLVKIGFSRECVTRLRQLECGSPVPLELVAVVEGCDMAVEKKIQRYFAPYRSHGEWFRPNDALSSLLDGHPTTLALGAHGSRHAEAITLVATPYGSRAGLGTGRERVRGRGKPRVWRRDESLVFY